MFLKNSGFYWKIQVCGLQNTGLYFQRLACLMKGLVINSVGNLCSSFYASSSSLNILDGDVSLWGPSLSPMLHLSLIAVVIVARWWLVRNHLSSAFGRLVIPMIPPFILESKLIDCSRVMSLDTWVLNGCPECLMHGSLLWTLHTHKDGSCQLTACLLCIQKASENSLVYPWKRSGEPYLPLLIDGDTNFLFFLHG